MKRLINVTIELKNLLRGLSVENIDLNTLVGKPITQGDNPVGIIQSISEDEKYVNGVIWSEVGLEVFHDSKKDKYLYSSMVVE